MRARKSSSGPYCQLHTSPLYALCLLETQDAMFEMVVVVELRLLRVSLSFYVEGALVVLREWSSSLVESGRLCFDFCMRAGG